MSPLARNVKAAAPKALPSRPTPQAPAAKPKAKGKAKAKGKTRKGGKVKAEQ